MSNDHVMMYESDDSGGRFYVSWSPITSMWEEYFHDIAEHDTCSVTRLLSSEEAYEYILHYYGLNKDQFPIDILRTTSPSELRDRRYYQHLKPKSYFLETKEEKQMEGDMRNRLASSTHYLRYFILGGYIAFLSQLPHLLESSLTLRDIAILGGALTFICIVMDLRNYAKYRNMAGGSGFPITTVFLILFYAACFYWFVKLPSSEYQTRRYEHVKAKVSESQGHEVADPTPVQSGH